MFELVDRLEGHTAARVTIADSIRRFLHVRHSVDQPGFGTLAKNLFCFLARDFPAQTVFDEVMAQPAEM